MNEWVSKKNEKNEYSIKVYLFRVFWHFDYAMTIYGLRIWTQLMKKFPFPSIHFTAIIKLPEDVSGEIHF